MKQGAIAQTAVVTLAVPSLVNDVFCKRCPHEFDLLIRNVNPTGLDGLPSGIKRSNEDVHGVRIKDAGLYVIVVIGNARGRFRSRRRQITSAKASRPARAR